MAFEGSGLGCWQRRWEERCVIDVLELWCHTPLPCCALKLLRYYAVI